MLRFPYWSDRGTSLVRCHYKYDLGLLSRHWRRIMNFSARVILLLLACLATCWAVVYDDVTQLPGSDYDFVIVGGTYLFRVHMFPA
jgi:hypothetical protein